VRLPTRRWRTILATVTLAGVLSFALGPRITVDLSDVGPVEFPGVSTPGSAGLALLESGIADQEGALPDIVPGTEKSIAWANPLTPARTRWSVLYLHGFSATRKETEPLPQVLADTLDANLFLTRLAGHGRGGDAMLLGSVEGWVRDAEEAVVVGDRISREGVVVVGTSTGGSLALWLASRSALRDRIAAVLLISPNLGVRDQRAELLLLPWGAHLARMVQGERHSWEPANDLQARYWTTAYPVEALLPMQALVREVRSLSLDSIRAPIWTAYSDEDPVVNPQEIRSRLSPAVGVDRILWEAPVEDGEDAHVLAGEILSPAGTEPLLRGMLEFLEARGVAPSTRLTDAGPPLNRGAGSDHVTPEERTR